MLPSFDSSPPPLYSRLCYLLKQLAYSCDRGFNEKTIQSASIRNYRQTVTKTVMWTNSVTTPPEVNKTVVCSNVDLDSLVNNWMRKFVKDVPHLKVLVCFHFCPPMSIFGYAPPSWTSTYSYVKLNATNYRMSLYHFACASSHHMWSSSARSSNTWSRSSWVFVIFFFHHFFVTLLACYNQCL